MGANALKILKRDAVGRVSYRAEQREAILDEFERNRLSNPPSPVRAFHRS